MVNKEFETWFDARFPEKDFPVSNVAPLRNSLKAIAKAAWEEAFSRGEANAYEMSALMGNLLID